MAFPLATKSQSSRVTRRLMVGAAAVCALTVLPLSAQQASYSTSSNRALLGGEDIDGSSIGSPVNPSPAAASAALPQYGGSGGGYNGYHGSRWDHVALEFGGGLTVPVGNDVNGGFTTVIGDGNNYGTETWGGNFLVGGGWSFSKKFTLFGEYEFNSNKIPGKTLSAVYNANAANYASNGINNIGGNVHTNSLTAEPMFTYYSSDKHSYAGYLIGGVGWSHKTVSFTAPVEEESFYGIYVVNETFSSYADNGLNVNFGTGVSYKIFGPDSRAKLFGEVRYVLADTPRETEAEATNTTTSILHTGSEGLIPITVGLRF